MWQPAPHHATLRRRRRRGSTPDRPSDPSAAFPHRPREFVHEYCLQADGGPNPVEAAGVEVGSRLMSIDGTAVFALPFKQVSVGRMMLRTPLVQSALRHSILTTWQNHVLNLSWGRICCGPHPKDRVPMADTTPTTDVERRRVCCARTVEFAMLNTPLIQSALRHSILTTGRIMF